MPGQPDDGASCEPQLLGGAGGSSQKSCGVENCPPVVCARLNRGESCGQRGLVRVQAILGIAAPLGIANLQACGLDPQQLISRPGLQKLIGKVREMREAALQDLQVGCGDPRALSRPWVRWVRPPPDGLSLASEQVHGVLDDIFNLSFRHVVGETLVRSGFKPGLFLRRLSTGTRRLRTGGGS